MKIIGLLFFLFAGIGFAAEALDQARETFGASTNMIEQAYAEAVKAAGVEYHKALVNGTEQLRKVADLDGMVAMKEEVVRYDQERTVPEPGPEDHRAIQRPRKRYAGAVAKARAARDGAYGKLLTQYVNHLEQLQKKLVVDDRIEEAVAVRAEAEAWTSRLTALKKAEAERRKLLAENRPPPHRPSGFLSGPTLPAGLSRHLIGHYAFDRNETTSITDKSPKRNHGKPREVDWVSSGKRGGALKVAYGKTLIALPPEMVSGLKEFTICGWAKLPRYRGGSWPCIISGYASSRSANVGLGVSQSSGHQWFEVLTKTGNPAGRGTLAIPWDTWYHGAVTYTGTTLQEFLNGEPGKVIPATGEVRKLDGLYIASHGGRYDPSGYSGLLDEIMFFDKALTPEELQQLYRSQK